MATEKTYTVTSADYLDEQDGIIVGRIVTAVIADSPTMLLVTAIGDKILNEPVAVTASQLLPV